MRLENSNSLPFAFVQPEAVGVSSEAVLRFLRSLDRHSYRLHAFMLARRGKLCFAGACAPYTLQTPHRVYSAAKSILALSVCAAVQEGKLRADAPVADYFRDLLAGDTQFDTMTTDDLLTMRSGQETDPFPAILTDLDADLTRLFFTVPPVEAPGATYRYNNTIPTVLCDLVERAVGMPFAEYQRTRLLEPLDAQTFAPVNKAGQYNPVVTAMSAETLMKFALLFLQEGLWNGNRLINADLVRECVREHTLTGMAGNAAGYGWQIWRNAFGGYRMDGGWGQYAIVLPEEELAAVILSDMPNPAFALEAFEAEILYGLSPAALMGSSAAQDELKDYGLRMSLAPGEGSAHSPKEVAWFSRRYRFADPAMEIRFAAEGGAVRIRIDETGRTEEYRCGLNGAWETNDRHLLVTPERTVDNGVYCLPIDPCLFTAIWRDADTLENSGKSLGAQGEYVYRFTFTPDGLNLAYSPRPCRGGPSLDGARILAGKGAFKA